MGVDMKAIGLGAAGHAAVVHDQCCGPSGLDDRHESLSMALELVVGAAVAGDDDSCGIAALERVTDNTGTLAGIFNVWRNQYEAAAVSQIRHVWRDPSGVRPRVGISTIRCKASAHQPGLSTICLMISYTSFAAVAKVSLRQAATPVYTADAHELSTRIEKHASLSKSVIFIRLHCTKSLARRQGLF